MRIRVSLPTQTLELRRDEGHLLRRYVVSTAANGAGELSGSFCTPRGRHRIRAKIGAGHAPNTVFVRRRPTGEIWSQALGNASPDRDWILTRILWLSGCEPGYNRLGKVDTMRRYIYIHGSPDNVPFGVPGSHGCVRMRNADIVELFDLVTAGTDVEIVDFSVIAGSWEMLGDRAAKIRKCVFIDEQHVPENLEWDCHDAASFHVVVEAPDGSPIATGRLLPDGHLGRFAVLAPWRGRGIGRAVMDSLLDEAESRKIACLMLHAQIQAEGFYRSFGFCADGDVFLEAGIPHRLMTKRLG